MKAFKGMFKLDDKMMKDVSDLYRKITQRLDSQKVQNSEATTSITELTNAVIYELGLFNNIFLNREKQNIRIINKFNGYGKYTLKSVEKKIPRVSKIIPFVSENGYTGIELDFAYGDGISIGKVILDEKFMDKNYGQLDETIKNNKEIFKMIFDALEYFTYEYPGFSFAWDNTGYSKYNQQFSDGFICCDFNVTNPDLTRVSLSKLTDLELSRIITKSHGELYDYIEMYQDTIKNRTAVDVNSLNPFLKLVLNKFRSISEEQTLTL